MCKFFQHNFDTAVFLSGILYSYLNYVYMQRILEKKTCFSQFAASPPITLRIFMKKISTLFLRQPAVEVFLVRVFSFLKTVLNSKVSFKGRMLKDVESIFDQFCNIMIFYWRHFLFSCLYYMIPFSYKATLQ